MTVFRHSHTPGHVTTCTCFEWTLVILYIIFDRASSNSTTDHSRRHILSNLFRESTDEQIRLQSKVHLEKCEHKIGMYVGMDGQKRLNLDVAERIDASGNIASVHPPDPGRTL